MSRGYETSAAARPRAQPEPPVRARDPARSERDISAREPRERGQVARRRVMSVASSPARGGAEGEFGNNDDDFVASLLSPPRRADAAPSTEEISGYLAMYFASQAVAMTRISGMKGVRERANEMRDSCPPSRAATVPNSPIVKASAPPAATGNAPRAEELAAAMNAAFTAAPAPADDDTPSSSDSSSAPESASRPARRRLEMPPSPERAASSSPAAPPPMPVETNEIERPSSSSRENTRHRPESVDNVGDSVSSVEGVSASWGNDSSDGRGGGGGEAKATTTTTTTTTIESPPRADVPDDAKSEATTVVMTDEREVSIGARVTSPRKRRARRRRRRRFPFPVAVDAVFALSKKTASDVAAFALRPEKALAQVAALATMFLIARSKRRRRPMTWARERRAEGGEDDEVHEMYVADAPEGSSAAMLREVFAA